MEVKEFLSEQRKEWNEFIAANSLFNVLQSWEWGEIKKGKNWEALRLGVYRENKQVAAAQILIKKLPFNFRILYSPYGPVINWEGPQSDTGEILKSIKEYLVKISKNKRFLFWKIEPTIKKDEADKLSLPDILNKIGFKKNNKSIQPGNTSIVDLTRSEEDILKSFDKDTRYSIKRAEREKTEIKKIISLSDIDSLKSVHNLCLITAKRGGFISRTWKEIEKVWETMAPDHVRLYQAWFKENLLAGVIVLTFGEKGYLLYAGSIRDKELNNKFPNYLLYWEIIKDLKKEGYKKLDLWGIAPKAIINHPWSKISLFKKGFRGEEIEYFGAYDLPFSPLYFFYLIADNLRMKMNNCRKIIIKLISR